jgi:hypothetical protein
MIVNTTRNRESGNKKIVKRERIKNPPYNTIE